MKVRITKVSQLTYLEESCFLINETTDEVLILEFEDGIKCRNFPSLKIDQDFVENNRLVYLLGQDRKREGTEVH